MDDVTMRKIHSESGGAIVETALMVPWILFLFICIFDFGFFSYASICTQNAARAAALRAAIEQSSINSCTAALGELVMLPNVRTAVTTCAALPVIATAVQLAASTT